MLAASSAAWVTLQYPTKDGGHWDLTSTQIDAWATAYPALDVRQECAHAREWVLADTSRRKTAKGMAKFLVGWLNRATPAPVRTPAPSEPADQPWSCHHVERCAHRAMCAHKDLLPAKYLHA